MQSSTGQYSTQAGEPAQPVQHSVITASSLGFFLRGVTRPLDFGSNLSSSGTIPTALVAPGAAGMPGIIAQNASGGGRILRRPASNWPATAGHARALRAPRGVAASPADGAIASSPAGPGGRAGHNQRSCNAALITIPGTSGLPDCSNCGNPDSAGRSTCAGALPAHAVHDHPAEPASPSPQSGRRAQPIRTSMQHIDQYDA